MYETLEIASGACFGVPPSSSFGTTSGQVFHHPHRDARALDDLDIIHQLPHQEEPSAAFSLWEDLRQDQGAYDRFAVIVDEEREPMGIIRDVDLDRPTPPPYAWFRALVRASPTATSTSRAALSDPPAWRTTAATRRRIARSDSGSVSSRMVKDHAKPFTSRKGSEDKMRPQVMFSRPPQIYPRTSARHHGRTRNQRNIL